MSQVDEAVGRPVESRLSSLSEKITAINTEKFASAVQRELVAAKHDMLMLAENALRSRAHRVAACVCYLVKVIVYDAG